MNHTPKLQLIGTGTCAYDKERMSSSVYVQFETGSFVFDIGRGVSNRLIFDLELDPEDISTIWLNILIPSSSSISPTMYG